MINTSSSAGQNNKKAALIFGLFLFIANLVGFTAFRCSISGDLFGGDLYSFTRNTTSYLLTYADILKPDDFFYGLRSSKNSDPNSTPSAFLWSRLSDRGRQSAERISSGSISEWDKELFMVELNKSLVDASIEWPKHFFKNTKEGVVPRSDISNRKYNIRVLAALFPQMRVPTYLDKMSLGFLADRMLKSLPNLFTLREPTRYAPLSNFYTETLRGYLQNSPERIWKAIAVQAVFYALLMTLVFFLALEFFSSIPWAFFSVLLFQAAVSTILSTFTIFCLPYFFVPLVTVAALLCYLRYKRSGHKGYLIGFIGLAIVGPWFREFAGLIPYVVLANEVLNFKKRRSVLIMAVCVLLCAHSAYPSFLTWLVGLNKGDFFSVYSQGNRQHLMTPAMNWMSPGMLFVEVPPILWTLAWLSMGFWVWRSRLADVLGAPSFMGLKFDLTLLSRPKIHKILRIVIVLFMILIPFLAGYYFFGHYKDQEWQFPGEGAAQGFSVLAVILTLSLFVFRFNTLMPVYFLMVFLPFMRIGGNTEVHMSFALAPLSIIILLWIRNLYQMLSGYAIGAMKNICLVGLSFFFLLGISDQAANVGACRSSQRAVVLANKEMAAWIRTNLVRHSVVICNFFNFYDIFDYSDYYFDPYETVENCPMGPGNIVHADQDFERLAKKYFDLVPFYFLANRIKYYEYQKNYHAHKYAKNPPGDLEELRRFEVKNVYYYFDPLKFFIMRRFQGIPLYMDWSIDFYYNNTGSMFQRVVSAEYTLYRLKNLSKLHLPPPKIQETPAAAPMLKADEPLTAAPALVGSHGGYNLVYYSDRFYAIPQSLGSLDVAIKANRERPGIVTGSSVKKVKKNIDKAHRAAVLTHWQQLLEKIFDLIAAWFKGLFHSAGLR